MDLMTSDHDNYVISKQADELKTLWKALVDQLMIDTREDSELESQIDWVNENIDGWDIYEKLLNVFYMNKGGLTKWQN